MVTVNEVAWNDEIETLVNRRLPIDIGTHTLRILTEQGRVQIYNILKDDLHLGYFFARVDVLPNGTRELAIMHGVSIAHTPKPFTHIISGIFPWIARQRNCQKLRIHSSQRKLDSLLEDNGLRFRESVFEREV